MGSIALRRTKETVGPDGKPLVSLAPKTVTIVQLDLAPEDALNYSRLEAESKNLVRSRRGKGKGIWWRALGGWGKGRGSRGALQHSNHSSNGPKKGCNECLAQDPYP